MSGGTSNGSTRARILPTEAMEPRRQLELLDVTARLQHKERDGAPIGAVSAAMGISEKTIAGAHGFLRQNGLLEPGCQMFALTPAGQRLAELRSADSARARLHLGELWSPTWFTTAAIRLLEHGPQEAAVLAQHLARGLSKRIERGLHLVHWLEYALVIRKGEDGQMELAREAARAPAPPLLGSSEAITALPRERFLAVMDGYRTIIAALASAPEPANSPPDSPPRTQ
ncbi:MULTISPECIES: hypothetical protein [unclassified Streptomyces]|uniref:hypothetical protein n=1 Tax=unclassified Streptomyces TaxID=2593676 RepID=UPI002DDC70BD|nr:hypothetical protein [Streptomyces sp. NBC_01750]WSB02210.1 hypothetical protein OIE54_24740 [Streptomyces sp. NBC_01794]WSD33534.1 hypothetical protein OG966_17455 [Streptomyces sp. NBC_01750]